VPRWKDVVIGYGKKTAAAAFFSSLKSLECISAWLQKKTATACDGWSSVTVAPKDTREARLRPAVWLWHRRAPLLPSLWRLIYEILNGHSF